MDDVVLEYPAADPILECKVLVTHFRTHQTQHWSCEQADCLNNRSVLRLSREKFESLWTWFADTVVWSFLHYWVEVFSFVFLLVLVSKSLVNRFSAEHSELLNHSERMERRSFYTSSSLEDQKGSCLQIWRYGDIKLNIYLAYHFGPWVIWTLAISPRKGFLLPFLANHRSQKDDAFSKIRQQHPDLVFASLCINSYIYTFIWHN